MNSLEENPTASDGPNRQSLSDQLSADFIQRSQPRPDSRGRVFHAWRSRSRSLCNLVIRGCSTALRMCQVSIARLPMARLVSSAMSSRAGRERNRAMVRSRTYGNTGRSPCQSHSRTLKQWPGGSRDQGDQPEAAGHECPMCPRNLCVLCPRCCPLHRGQSPRQLGQGLQLLLPAPVTARCPHSP